MDNPSNVSSTKTYHIALSFAGENRDYVEAVAKSLKRRGVRVFYDKYEEAQLWGKDLYWHLSDVYRKQANFTVVFISRHYKEKLWTNHERQSAQARAFEESQEYILPVRFDDTEIPGILPTTGYINLSSRTPEDLAQIVLQKLIAHKLIGKEQIAEIDNEFDPTAKMFLEALRNAPPESPLHKLGSISQYCIEAANKYID